MKKLYLMMILVGMALVFPLTACNAEETKTVEWYMKPENKTALDTKLAECRNNPGELKDTPNCVNARQAAERIFKGGTFEKVREPKYGF